MGESPFSRLRVRAAWSDRGTEETRPAEIVPTVDDKHPTGHIGGERRGEENRHRGDVFDRPEAAERRRVAPLFAQILGLDGYKELMARMTTVELAKLGIATLSMDAPGTGQAAKITVVIALVGAGSSHR